MDKKVEEQISTAALQWQSFVTRKVTDGMEGEQIVKEMTARNWPEAEARAMIRKVASKQRWRALTALVGFLALAIVGVVVSAASYESAAQGGGTYYVWYGAVVTGLPGAIWALVRLLKIRA